MILTCTTCSHPLAEHCVYLGCTEPIFDRPKAAESCPCHRTALDQLAETVADLDRLRTALEWYSDPDHWACPFDYCWLNSHNNECTSAAIYDRGERARQALAEETPR